MSNFNFVGPLEFIAAVVIGSILVCGALILLMPQKTG